MAGYRFDGSMLGGAAIVLVGFTVSVPARAEIDASAEVAAALYQANATLVATQKADDDKLRGMRRQIDGLQSQVRTGRAKHAAETQALRKQLAEMQTRLEALQNRYVGQLAAKDENYGLVIAHFRSDVAGAASTPAGAAAVAQFNEGDAIGALAKLDNLNAQRAGVVASPADKAGAAAAKRHAAALALDARDKGKLTTASVIARYEEVVQLDPGVFWDWITLCHLYQDAGRISDAAHAIDMAHQLANNDRDKSIALNALGNVRIAQGDIAGADKAYAESLGIANRLSSASPGDRQAKRAVSIGLESLGDIGMAQGDIGAADAAYAKDLAIARRLAAAEPNNRQVQRDLSVSLDRLGNTRLAQGKPVEAEAAYREGLAISRRLAAADPRNVEIQRDVLISLDKIGDVRMGQNDVAGAEKAYTESLAMARSLAAADPGQAEVQRDILVGLSKIGGIRADGDDISGADEAYAESLAIARRLAAADPTSAEAQRDVSDTLESIGDLRSQAEDFAAAVKAYSECLAVRRRLAAADPRNAPLQHDLAVAMSKLAGLPGASVTWQQARGAWEALAAKGKLPPADAQYLDEARRNATKEPIP